MPTAYCPFPFASYPKQRSGVAFPMASPFFWKVLSLVQKRRLQTSASKLVNSSPLATPSNSSAETSFTVDYLINSCGLSPQSALSASKRLRLEEENLHKYQTVLQFLKAHNFEDTHIVQLIEKKPLVLLCGVQGNLKPKFDFLIKNGFVGRLLHEFLMLDPLFIDRSLLSHIKPCFDFLRRFFHSNEEVVAIFRRYSRLLSSGNLVANARANVDFLIKEGVPTDGIGKLLIRHPRAVTQNLDRTVYAVIAIKNLGLQPKSPMFLHAIRVMLQQSESTWKKKIEVFKSLGCSLEETMLAFKRNSCFMRISEEKIRNAMDFYINTIKFGRQDIVSCPVLLTLSINERVRPRWNVIQILMSNHLIRKDFPMKGVLMTSEKLFLQKFVSRHMDDIPALLEIYRGTNKAMR